MFAKCVRFFVNNTLVRKFSEVGLPGKFKVTVLGACGDMGQALCLLLSLNPLVKLLKLFDTTPLIHGVAMDLSHITMGTKIKSFVGHKQLYEAVSDVDAIVISLGLTRKPGMTRMYLFQMNSNIICDLAEIIGNMNPGAAIIINTGPVNKCVILYCEMLRKAGKLDPKRVFGMCNIDQVRARKFTSELTGVHPADIHVPVIGGHTIKTIVPVFSQAKPDYLDLTPGEIVELTERVKHGGNEVVKLKGAMASQTSAYATAGFLNNLMRALNGEKNIIDTAFVSSQVTECNYFSNPLLLGKDGIELNLGIGTLSEFEKELLKVATSELLNQTYNVMGLILNRT